MSNNFLKFFFVILITIIFILVIFTYYFTENIISSSDLTNEFIWPIPNYTTITSSFGYRTAPTKGASTYHSGIDIAAPTGTNILAISDGTVIFTGFSGAGGYTVTIENESYKVSYCHVSPFFVVNLGQKIFKGNIIANVGPKNVYGVLNNPYKDSNR